MVWSSAEVGPRDLAITAQLDAQLGLAGQGRTVLSSIAQPRLPDRLWGHRNCGELGRSQGPGGPLLKREVGGGQ